MNLSDTRKKMFELLTPLSLDLGYKINKSQYLLSKKEQNKTSQLHFTYNYWFDEIQIFPYVDVNIKEINDIWIMFDEYISYTYSMNLKKLKDFYDIGDIDWTKFNDGERDRYKIFNIDNDLVDTCNKIEILFQKYGVKYITDFGSIEGVDKIYNNLKESNNPHCAGFQVRSVVGLISAKLSDNKNYDEISNFYTAKIKQHEINNSMTKKDIEIFYNVKKYLG